jgi:hypothetical protein
LITRQYHAYACGTTKHCQSTAKLSLIWIRSRFRFWSAFFHGGVIIWSSFFLNYTFLTLCPVFLLIKDVGCTPFSKDHINSSTFRGFFLPDPATIANVEAVGGANTPKKDPDVCCFMFSISNRYSIFVFLLYISLFINHFFINYFWCRKSWMWGPLKAHHYICSRTSLVPHPQLIFRQLARLCRKQATCHCVFFVGRLYTQKLISS